MLRPQDTATRERKSLNGLWRFALDGAGEGRAAEWFRRPLADAREMAVPASFNDIAADAAVRDYFGDVWYQTTVRVPRGWDGQRIVLHFESATHRATVWVNDAEVVSHEGGYTPFEADVTEHVRAGDEARITVVVNNTLSFQTIPPGVIEDTPDGKRQRYWHDFFNYAGLHRPVWLYATGRAHLTDVTVVTGLDGANGLGRVPDRGHRRRRRRGQGRAARRRRRRGRHRHRRRAAPSRWTTSTGGPRATATSTTSRSSWSTTPAASWTATTRASACARSSRGRHPVPHQRRAVLLHRLRQARGPRGDRQGPQRRLPACTTSSCSSGSAPTPSGPRTTPTPRTSSTTPTARASSSSTRRPRSGLNMGLGGGIFGGQGYTTFSPGDDQRRRPARCTRRRSASWWPATRTTPASCCGPSPTSPSPTPRARSSTSSRCSS